MRSHRNKFTGFSLVEILAVLVIIGVAAAMVVPRIGIRDDLKLSAASRVIMANLIFAQNRAIAQQKFQYVKFDTSAKTFSVLDTASPVAYVTDPVSLKNATYTVGTSTGLVGITLTSVNFDNKTTIGFDELGTPYAYDTSSNTSVQLANSGSIVLTCGNSTMTISIEPYTGEMGAQ